MADKEYPLSLIIKAVDQATAPMRKINERIREMTAPARALGNSLKGFAEESGLSRLGERAKNFGSALKNVGSELVGTIKELALMEVIGGVALFELVKGSAEAGEKLKLMSDRTGIAVDSYAQLQFAVGRFGVSQDDFNGAMDKFNRNLGELKRDSGSLFGILSSVAPQLAQQLKGAKNNEQAFNLMADAIKQVKDPAKQAALTQAAFGKGSAGLVNALKQGAVGLETYRKRFEEIAGPQDKFAEAGETIMRRFSEVGVVLESVRNRAFTAFAPVVDKLAKAFEGFVTGHAAEIQAWFEGLAKTVTEWVDGGGVERLTKQVSEFFKGLQPVVDLMGGWGKSIAIVAGLIVGGPLIASILSLGVAFVSMLAAVFPVAAAFSAILAPALAITAAVVGVAMAGYQVYKHWAEIKQLFVDVWEAMKPVIEATKNFAVDSIRNVKEFYFGKDPAAAAPKGIAEGIAGRGGDANVKIDFSNVPAGTKIMSQSSGPEINMSTGPAMITP